MQRKLENDNAENYSRIDIFQQRVKVSKCVFVINQWILTHGIWTLHCYCVAQNIGFRLTRAATLTDVRLEARPTQTLVYNDKTPFVMLFSLFVHKCF